MDDFLAVELVWFILVLVGYLLYYLIAFDEMRGRQKVKRMVWLVFIPGCFPVSFLIFFVFEPSFFVMIPAFVVSVPAWFVLAAVGEAAEGLQSDIDKRKGGTNMKDIELELLSELMRNSRRSDRDLAKAMESSQPMVTRTRNRLEREGCIKEYAMVPDFHKLGFEIMAFAFVKFRSGISPEEINELREVAKMMEKENPSAILMIMGGMGLGYDGIIASFHENYSDYSKFMRDAEERARLRLSPLIDISALESFVVSLKARDSYQLLTFSTIARYLLSMRSKRKE
jgi:DNA-binding Lrp family transcriptional regulator